MNQFEKARNKKIFEILIVLKVIYVLLAVICILSSNAIKNETQPEMLVIYSCAIPVLVALYFLWTIYSQKNSIGNKPRSKDIIETALLLIIFIAILFMTGGFKSSYKFICIFIILIGSIQFGRSYSLSISICSAVIIVAYDLQYIPIENTNPFFEVDLVLIGALLATSYIIGMYVNIEKEHGSQLITLVNKDELTGLYNHRYFQEYLEKSIEKSDKTEKELSLLFMDIDYFKNYNDINGHQSGDWLLKEVGTILKSCIRQNNDIVARYGGEEFAAILPDTKEEHAIIVGERIREAIQNTYFYGQENQPNKNITISIGVSSYPKRAKTKHQLINTADDALYRAKSFNKNRVETYHNVLEYICKHMDVSEDTVKSLKAFISMINKKDRYTYGHTERVVIYTNWFGEHLKLKEEQKIDLKIAAYLHDIGKVEIPEDVLNKKERLTDEEFNLLKKHPVVGADLIRHIEQFESFIPLIKHHHERYDGKGYPEGLKGEEIPYLARVLTIADSFDAMTSNRPYNTRKSHEEGIKELRSHAGTQFDPVLVEQFIDMLETFTNEF